MSELFPLLTKEGVRGRCYSDREAIGSARGVTTRTLPNTINENNPMNQPSTVPRPPRPLAVIGARVVLPGSIAESGMLTTDDRGRIEFAGMMTPRSPQAEVIEGRGLTLLPGFIDGHVHGGGGADFMDATPDALRTICRTHAAHGTTTLLATTITQTGDAIRRALVCVRQAVEAGAAFCPDGATIAGVHLEGPYLCAARAGAQPREFVRPYDPAEFDDWLMASGGTIKQITLAPEQPDAHALLARCREAGIAVSIGHTDATAGETRDAIKAGATHATHLFNAMPPLHHRAPGPVAVLLTDARVRVVEIIADGHHVAPEVIEMVLRARGVDRVALITDAMRGAGAGDGVYDLGGQPVTVAGGKALLPDGTLAGSVLTMAQAGANVRAWLGLDWHTVARLTSTNAADALGLSGKGRLAPGADADFVLVDDAGAVRATFIAGRCVYQAG